MSREIDSIRVEFIERLPGRRQVDEATVLRLMESIRKIGLRTPLSVRVVDGYDTGDGNPVDGQPVLVTGGHRLEAVRRLGWEKVDCFVLTDESQTQARMWEIAENLHRAELSALERDENVAEWIRLSEEELKSAQPEPKSKSANNPKGSGRKTSGVREASRDLGIEKEDARRATKVASLTPEAKQAARDVGLDDNRSALLTASKAEPEQQAAVIRKIADDKVERALLKPVRTVPDAFVGLASKQYEVLSLAWEVASDEVRIAFLQQLPARYRAAA